MSRLRFRNVDADPDDPVETWPLEAMRTAIEGGDLADYRRIVAAIAAQPWGPVARGVEQVLEWSSPYGAATIMRRAIERARKRWKCREREWVRAQLHDALVDSGLPRGEFASRLGTSATRLSTYLTGRVVPSATVLARAHALAGQAGVAPQERGQRQSS